MKFSHWLLAVSAVLICARSSDIQAQSRTPQGGSVDLALTFAAQRSLRIDAGQNFWTEGGSMELGVNAYRGFGIAADITGTQTASMGTSGVPLAWTTVTFGPRYRWHDGHRLSVYGQGLVGEANAFHSLFPSPSGAQDDANSLATQVGGGLDVSVSRHIAIRAIDAAWLRTQLPNSVTNVQNNLRVAAGIVFRFRN